MVPAQSPGTNITDAFEMLPLGDPTEDGCFEKYKKMKHKDSTRPP